MASEDSTLPSASQAIGVIPHFFYDIIGRIIPGAFVIVSVVEMFGLSPQLSFLKDGLTKTPQADATGYVIFLGTAALLTMVVAAYLVGFMLAAPAYQMCEKFLVKQHGWLFFRPLTLEGLLNPEGSAVAEQERVQKAFEESFGFDLNMSNAGSVQRQSGLCAYYVWLNNSNLGQITSRWDAEALGCRTILFAALFLFVIRFIQLLWWLVWLGAFYWKFALFLIAVVVTGWSMYRYHRERHISGRFSLFVACLAVQNPRSKCDKTPPKQAVLRGKSKA